MSIAKVTEVIASSTTSLEDAIQQGVSRADKTLENVEGVWVKDIKGKVDGGKIAEWRVTMAITFILKD
jgi:flavin-binding protein dodecin